MICMAPAAIAVTVTFAAMGATGMPLGVATSMFASMVLGVGVDFAIHMVQRYRVMRSRSASHDEAISQALSVTGPPLLVNALAIALGFGMLTLSRVPANAHLGMIAMVSLVGCLAATLLVVPALLRVTSVDSPRALQTQRREADGPPPQT
jgi:predicted RND superfamily exporter protein